MFVPVAEALALQLPLPSLLLGLVLKELIEKDGRQ
jgi:hypothetical protein